MRGGDLSNIVNLQEVSHTTNAINEDVETWTTLWWDYAAVEWVGTREFPEAQKRHAESTTRFRLRYRRIPKINPAKHRIRMVRDPNTSPPDVSTWNIHGVQYPSRLELLIEASEVV